MRVSHCVFTFVILNPHINPPLSYPTSTLIGCSPSSPCKSGRIFLSLQVSPPWFLIKTSASRVSVKTNSLHKHKHKQHATDGYQMKLLPLSGLSADLSQKFSLLHMMRSCDEDLLMFTLEDHLDTITEAWMFGNATKAWQVEWGGFS